MNSSTDPSKIKIVILPGSVRPGNFTAKAVALVVDELQRFRDVETRVFDFSQTILPLPGTGQQSPELTEFKETVAAATGIVMATPEYHGTFSSVTKLAIENLGFPSVMAGKPVALLGVAAGAIGAIKSLEQLRGVCSHVGSIVLPGPISVAGVQGVFDEQGRCSDAAIEARIRSVATNLIEYIHGHLCQHIALEELVRDDDTQ